MRKIAVSLLSVSFAFVISNIPTQTTYNVRKRKTSQEDRSVETENLLNNELDFHSDRLLVVLKSSNSQSKGVSDFVKVTLKNILPVTQILSLSDNLTNSIISTDKFHQILRVDLTTSSKSDVLLAVEKLKSNSIIQYVGPDYIYQPNDFKVFDPYFMNGEQWGLNGTYGIDAPSVWDKIEGGSNKVTVGVIDSGIAFHEDLYTQTTINYDFVNNNQTTTDDDCGHGSHVAGIIASAKNSTGTIGVASNIKLAPLQITYKDSKGDYVADSSTVIKAITFATERWNTPWQISILNYSYSGFGIDTSLLYSISQYPGLFVWSCGNEKNNVDSFANIKKFKLDNLICVGSIDRYGTLSSFSNYGSNIDIYAPGENILSCGNTYSSYVYMSGTSMAAPFVSGTAALLLSENPGLTANQIKESIINGSNSIMVHNVKSARLSASKAFQYANSRFDNIPCPLRLSVSGKEGGT